MQTVLMGLVWAWGGGLVATSPLFIVHLRQARAPGRVAVVCALWLMWPFVRLAITTGALRYIGGVMGED